MVDPQTEPAVSSPGSAVAGVTRRDVLTRIAGFASLAAFPGLLAACGPAGSEGSATTATAVPPGTAGTTSGLVRTVSLGSNFSDEVPRNAMQSVADLFTAASDIEVNINTIDRDQFRDTIGSYLQGTPDDVLTWTAGHRMRYFADQGLIADISDVWDRIGDNLSEGFKSAFTANDGRQYGVPFYTYPWVILYRKSFFQDGGYEIPETLDDFIALSQRMQTDGFVPLAFGNVDGWPAMGTFDILNMRLNGYDFHIGLMAGTEKWTDSRVKNVYEAWAELLPYHQVGANGRRWQDAAQSMIAGEAGMYFLGTFAGEQAADDPEIHADLDFFPFPLLGTEYDSEQAIDAPIDGFLVSKAPADVEAAMAFAEFLASGPAQVEFLKVSPNNVAAARDADTSGYSAFQQRAAEIIDSSNRLAQFLDRDTRGDFAGPNGMQQFIQTFIENPEQNLDEHLGGIQAFWDSLGPEI